MTTMDSTARAALQRQLHQAAARLARLLDRGRREGWIEGDASTAAALATAPEAADETALRQLADRLALSPTLQQVLWQLVACELDPRVRRVVEGLQREGHALTLGALMDTVYAEDPALATLELALDGPLVRFELVEVAPEDAHRPMSARRLRVRERVLELACGVVRLDPSLEGIAAVQPPGPALADLEFALADRSRLQAALRDLAPGLVIVHGRTGTGRCAVLAAAIVMHERAALVVDARALPREAVALRRMLRVIAREVRLLALVPVFRDLDALDGTGDDAGRLTIFEQELVGPVFATTTQRIARRWTAPPTVVELGDLETSQRARLWQRALPDAADGDADILANLYPLAPSLIAAVGAVALREAGAEVLTPDHIAHGVRVVLDDRLAGLATRLTITQSWDDLVLPDDQATAIIELLARVRERRTVFEDWGFGDKVGKGLGTIALFSGPSRDRQVDGGRAGRRVSSARADLPGGSLSKHRVDSCDRRDREEPRAASSTRLASGHAIAALRRSGCPLLAGAPRCKSSATIGTPTSR